MSYMKECESTGPAVKVATQLDEVYDALRQSMELAAMVNVAASRICGSSGDQQANKLSSVSDGILNDLNGRARDANSAIAEARESIIRINRAFGL